MLPTGCNKVHQTNEKTPGTAVNGTCVKRLDHSGVQPPWATPPFNGSRKSVKPTGGHMYCPYKTRGQTERERKRNVNNEKD